MQICVHIVQNTVIQIVHIALVWKPSKYSNIWREKMRVKDFVHFILFA